MRDNKQPKCSADMLLAMAFFGLVLVASTEYFSSPGFIRDVMIGYKWYCPQVSTCVQGSLSPTNDSENTTVDDFCCDGCSCEHDCGFKCCPDVLRDLNSLDEYIDNFLQQPCTAAIYTTRYLQRPDHNFRMFVNCPHDYMNKPVIEKCERPYNKFDFSSGNIEDLMPVSTDHANVYKNRNCAVCRGVNVASLVPWSMSLECEEELTHELTSFTDIPGFLRGRSDCAVYFIPPGGAFVAEKCFQEVIEHCNMTGRWQSYDYFTERACLSYTSIYKYNSNRLVSLKFRNVHCAMCNIGPNENLGSCILPKAHPDDVRSFTMLLDFSLNYDSIAVHHQPEKDCPQDQVYVKPLDSCEQIFCAHGLDVKSWNKFECLVPSKQTYSIYVNFRLTSKRTLDESFTMEDLHWKLKLDINTLLKLSEGQLSLDYIEMDAVFNDTMDNTINHLVSLQYTQYKKNETVIWMATSYLVLRIRFLTEKIQRVRPVLDKLENIFADDLLAELQEFHFNIEYQGSPFTKIAGIPSNLSVYRDGIHDLGLPIYIQDALLNGYEDMNLQRGVIKFILFGNMSMMEQTTTHVLELWPKPFCSRIYVQFANTLFDYAYSLLDQEADPVYGGDDKGVYICPNDFTTNVPIAAKQIENTYRKTTLISISLSITSLVLTLSVYLSLSQLQTWANINNISLALSLMVFHVSYLAGQSRLFVPGSPGCVAAALTLHWTLLVYIFWMTVSVYHVTRMFCPKPRVSSSLNLKKEFLRCLVGVVLVATVFVGVNVVYGLVWSGHNTAGYGGSACYVIDDRMAFYTVGVPIGIAILTNIIMFTICVATYCRLPNISLASDPMLQKLKVVMKIFVITGGTWCFGYLYEFTKMEVFSYIFIVLNAGQGVLIFICFILNKRVLTMIKTSVCRRTSWARSSKQDKKTAAFSTLTSAQP